MYIKSLTKTEFDEFSKNFFIKSLYQTSAYAETMSTQNFKYLFVGLIDDNENIIAASVILIKNVKSYKYAYAPRGFLIDYNNVMLVDLFTQKLKKFLGKLDIVAIKISPYIIKVIHDPKHNVIEDNKYYQNIFNNLKNLGYKHTGYNHFFESYKPRFEGVLDLNQAPYLLFRNITGSYRNKIRNAEKKGIRVYKGNISNLDYLYLHTQKKYPRDLEYFKECYKCFDKNGMVDFFYTKINTSKYLEYIKKAYEKYENLVEQCNNKIIEYSKNNQDTSKLINQKMHYDKILSKYQKELVKATNMLRDNQDGIVSSSALVVKNQDEVYLLIDGLDPNYKNLNSKHLLIWKLIEKYSNEGYKRFNFGGMADPLVKESKFKGLNNFKLEFGCVVQEYIGDLELVTNNTLYFLFINNKFVKFFKS